MSLENLSLKVSKTANTRTQFMLNKLKVKLVISVQNLYNYDLTSTIFFYTRNNLNILKVRNFINEHTTDKP